LIRRAAGGIVFRWKGDSLQVLLVSARANRRRWVLPKGRLKRGESRGDAALREVREEAGARGTIVGAAGEVRQGNRLVRTHIEYFLIAYRGATEDAGEARRMKWCSPNNAAKLLSSGATRRMFREAQERLERAARQQR